MAALGLVRSGCCTSSYGCVGRCGSGSLCHTGDRCGLLLPGLWSWTCGRLSSSSGSRCDLARLALCRSERRRTRSSETPQCLPTTGCRLQHSSSLSCKCLYIAVCCGPGMWLVKQALRRAGPSGFGNRPCGGRGLASGDDPDSGG